MNRRKRIDPRVIGSFVVGAIILSVAGLLFFGPGGLLSETRTYVLHFDSSVKGLNVGSPVRFRGVKIGQVKDINVQVRPRDFEFHIPVIIEIEPSRISADGSSDGLFDALKTTVKGEDPIIMLVNKGLRAQLQMDSLVTGQLFINFDMLPDTPIELSGYSSEYEELPTVSSSLEELTKAFEDLPLNELADKLIRSAEGVEKIFTSPSLHNALAQFDTTTSQLNRLLENMNERLLPITDNLLTTVKEARTTIRRLDSRIAPLADDAHRTLASARETIDRINSKIDPLSQHLDASLASFKQASENTDQAMQQFQTLTDNDSFLLRQLSQTLEEINSSARSIRYLADELEREPQILLRGRTDQGGQE